MIKNRQRLLVTLSIVLLLDIHPANAQFDTSFVKKRIQLCADSLAIGFKAKNWNLFARYTNPSIIGSMGGKAAFIDYVDQSFADIPDSAWLLYKPERILQIIKTEADLQCLIELRSVVEWEGRRITSISHLIGQSWNGGLYWTFFDSQNNRLASEKIKPDLSPALHIPEKNEKVEPIPAAKQVKPKQN